MADFHDNFRVLGVIPGKLTFREEVGKLTHLNDARIKGIVMTS